MKLGSEPLAFVDIETTGGSYFHGRVLEVAVVRVEDNRVVDEFHTLLNPIGYVPEAITQLTGIDTRDVADAPQFSAVADRLKQILDGAVFVAHNVRFDYSFLKREFAHLGISFSPKLLCTLRLSRSLFPMHRGHSLQAIIERHGLQVAARHRAYDDAEALWQFYRSCLAEFDLDTVEQAIASQFKRQALPLHLTETDIQAIPDTPGVYIFDGEGTLPLYIGKSVNLRQRVLSHFHDDLSKASEFQISRGIRRIQTIPTTGELGALLLESKLIKELQPVHNKRLRRASQLASLDHITLPSGHSSVSFSHDGEVTDSLGLFPSNAIAKRTLLGLATEHELCKKLLGLEKSSGACFGYQIGKCRGACIGKEAASLYNQRFDAAFATTRIASWPYADAIMITERHPFVPGATAYVIKNWYLAAQITEGGGGETHIEPINLPFDLDAYKIVKSYLHNPKSKRWVREVALDDIMAFA